MQALINTDLNPLFFTWQDIESCSLIDECYYCILVFMNGESVPRETYIGIAASGLLIVELPDDVHIIDPLDQDDNIKIMVHPLPALKIEKGDKA